MTQFELLYRSVVDYDELYLFSNLEHSHNFSFFVSRINMIVPVLFPQLRNHVAYFIDDNTGDIIKFSPENEKKLLEIIENINSKILSVIVVQEIGTMNVLEIIYKSDEVDMYKSIIQSLIDNNKLTDLYFKKIDADEIMKY